MFDRLLSATMNLTVVGVISAATIACLMLGYWGLVQLCNGTPAGGAAAIAAAVLPGAIACKAARCRNDLVDR